MNPRTLEHGFRMTSAGIPYTLPYGHEDNDAPTFGLPLQAALFSHTIIALLLKYLARQKHSRFLAAASWIYVVHSFRRTPNPRPGT